MEKQMHMVYLGEQPLWVTLKETEIDAISWACTIADKPWGSLLKEGYSVHPITIKVTKQ